MVLAFSLAASAQGSYGSTSSQSRSKTSAQPSSVPQSDTAAQSSEQTGKTHTSSSSGKERAVTGCLEQGSSAGSYVIKNAKHPDGIQVAYSGSEDLSKHVGHKVKAMGSMSGDSLNATDIKHISETCSMNAAGEASGTHRHSHEKHSHESSTKGTSSSTTTEPGANPNPGAPAPK